jgi:hypothetical protein
MIFSVHLASTRGSTSEILQQWQRPNLLNP